MTAQSTSIWRDFFEYLAGYGECCQLKKLNSGTDQEIWVTQICHPDIINNFAATHPRTIPDTIFIDPRNKLFIGYIPSGSKISISLFCCKISMEDICSKISDYGLAISGCFNINPITLLPSFFRGNEFGTDNDITTNNATVAPYAYLVIDDHHIIQIMTGPEIANYKPEGVNVQYVEGLCMYRNGQPFVSFDTIKNVWTHGINDLPVEVDGTNTIMDYANRQIIINGKKIDFGEIDHRIKFANDAFFDMNNGLLVLATDRGRNIFILYHPHIDFFNMLLLLNMFGCQDAILLCNSDANMIWRQSGYNTYNRSDFIGNPLKKVSNIIVFAG